jgi:protein phosphatase
MSELDPRSIATASLSAVGCVRSQNEDYCSEFQDSAGRRLLVVADGMGGHKGGATASRVAVEAIGEIFEESPGDPEQTLYLAISTANERLHKMAMDNSELRGMGTTAVTLLLDQDREAWVAHVGDSRAYRLREGRIEALTRDHSVVAEMVRKGLLSEEQAAVHPRRNEILRSVGVETTVRPDVRQIEVKDGDRFLLCSDGLSNLMSEEEIAAVVQREPPSQAARTLVDTANSRGAPDNVTVQIAAVPGGVTTEIERRAALSPAMLDRDLMEQNREQKVKRIAAVTAAIAGLLALAMLWLVFGSGLALEGAGSAPASATSERSQPDGRR